MINMNKEAKIYLSTTFIWTWTFWIVAYLINRGIDPSATIFSITGNTPITQIIFMLGVYGPLIGFIIASRDWKVLFSNNLSVRIILLGFLIPVLVVLPSFILSVLSLSIGKEFAVLTVILYFLSNLLTSGTEEIGWRGYLYNYLKTKEKNFWDISLKGGLIWAIWHYPVMVILYLPSGLFVLIPSLIGFTAGIVAMNYISNYLYEKSKSIPLMMIFHALNNTVSFTLLLLYPNNPYVIIVHLMAWLIVGYLDKKEKREIKA
jgi:membrane protease YdiL (CAAX protease family)